MTKTRERRACTTCGFERVVVVRAPWAHFPARWAKRCGACEMEASAERHLSAATNLIKRAAAIRAARRSKG